MSLYISSVTKKSGYLQLLRRTIRSDNCLCKIRSELSLLIPRFLVCVLLMIHERGVHVQNCPASH